MYIVLVACSRLPAALLYLQTQYHPNIRQLDFCPTRYILRTAVYLLSASPQNNMEVCSELCMVLRLAYGPLLSLDITYHIRCLLIEVILLNMSIPYYGLGTW